MEDLYDTPFIGYTYNDFEETKHYLTYRTLKCLTFLFIELFSTVKNNIGLCVLQHVKDANLWSKLLVF